MKLKKVLIIFVWLLFSKTIVFSEFLNLSEVELIKYYWPVSLMIDIHLELWEWIQDDWEFELYTNLLSEMNMFAKLDIVKYLKTSINLEETLMYSLNNLHSLLVKWSSAIDSLNQKMNVLVQTKNNCDDLKKISDKNYSLSLKDFKSKDMELYLNQSLENDKCSSESRIYYNAYAKIIEQLTNYYDILEMKYSYFLENKYDIIENLAK